MVIPRRFVLWHSLKDGILKLNSYMPLIAKGGDSVNTQKLPVGIDNFEKLRKEDFYYVDKTGLIIDLMKNWGEVNLFTRPCRFGKTLNMSMLRYFFEVGGDKSIFEGLRIAQEKEICEAHMGKYPVVFISLKGVDV